MITALQKEGGKRKATLYSEVQHDSWSRTYDDPELIRWIFGQHLKCAAAHQDLWKRGLSPDDPGSYHVWLKQ
jgi:hypothetical protein